MTDSNARVPLLDLRRGGNDLDAELEAAFLRVLHSGRYIMGPEVDSFEEECARYLGVRYALGVSSGTDALLMALMALDVGPGDEVVCPTFTFFATAGVVWRLGAKPVFVDSREGGFNIDPEGVERAMTDRTRAIIPVHLFGEAADMDALRAIADPRGVPIVEDAAQAIGAEYGGKRVGGLGAMACFSFFPAKNLGALGDAGLVSTDDDALAHKLRMLRVHGAEPKYVHAMVGGNFRLDSLQAALLRVKLPRLEEATERRIANATYYTHTFAERGVARTSGADEEGAAVILPEIPRDRHVFNQYVVRIPGAGRRDRVASELRSRGIDTAVYYPIPMHLQECFQGLGYSQGDFPVAEALCLESLALPVFPELTAEERERVVTALVEAVAS